MHFDAKLNVTEAYQKLFGSIDENSQTELINHDDLALPFFYVTQFIFYIKLKGCKPIEMIITFCYFHASQFHNSFSI